MIQDAYLGAKKAIGEIDSKLGFIHTPVGKQIKALTYELRTHLELLYAEAALNEDQGLDKQFGMSDNEEELEENYF